MMFAELVAASTRAAETRSRIAKRDALARGHEGLMAKSLESHRDSYTVYVWPELVVEIAFNNLQASPHYLGGLALRFARVKGYRPDKTPANADTIDMVRAIHASQLAKGNSDA